MTAGSRRLVGLVMLAAVAGTSAPAADEVKETSRSFRITIVSEITSKAREESNKINADTTLNYTNRYRGREVKLLFDSVQLKVISDGAEKMNASMSRDGIKTVRQGKEVEVKREDAPAELKAMLQDSFGTPLCTYTLDESSREVKRKVVAGPGAKSWLDNGTTAAARLFHPSFSSDRDSWQALNEVGMGGVGGFARGKLTYKKVDGAKGDRVSVRVSGTLTNDSYKLPGSTFAVTGARYEVSGEQTYDLRQGEWVAGDLLMRVSFRTESDGKEFGSAKGTIRTKFEMTSTK